VLYRKIAQRHHPDSSGDREVRDRLLEAVRLLGLAKELTSGISNALMM
jgi:hypothetical protein